MKKLSQRLKFIIATPVFILSLLTLQFVNVPFASAATLTWDGSAGDSNFNTAANWSTNAVPVNGDILNFDASILSANTSLNNNVSNLSVAGITFTGTPSSYGVFTLTGNSLTLTGSISSSSTFSGSPLAHILNLPVVLGANITTTNVHLNNTINTQTFSLGVAGTYTCGLNVGGAISGSGAINISSTTARVMGTNTTYSGVITITSGTSVVVPEAFGTTAGGTVVSGSGTLSIYVGLSGEPNSIAEPFTFGGTGSLSSQGDSSNFCSGAQAPVSTTTLTGGVTLTSDFVLQSSNNVTITGTYTPNGPTFSVAGGSGGTLTTPQGSVEVPSETLPFDGDSPSSNESIGNKQTGVLNGTRDSVYVGSGGLLIGTGTANTVTVSNAGTINPGQSPGTITVLEMFSTSGKYQAEILDATNYDQLVVGADYAGGGNAVSLQTDSTLEVVLYDGWTVKQGDQFRIIDNQSSTAVNGTFNAMPEGAQFTVEGITFSITYVGGDGNDVIITALNAGTDPTPPNTGAAQLLMANPALLAGLGIVTAGILIAVAMRRRSVR